MNTLILILKISLFITLLLISINFLIYINSYSIKKRNDKVLKKYEKDILKYLFHENSRNEILKEYKNKKIHMNLFIEKTVEIINTIHGSMRKDLIDLCDSLNISNTLIKKLNKPFGSRVSKELLLYQIGELRSKTLFSYLLNIDRTYLRKNDLYKSYFFAINNITNEWINELNETEINKYIDLVFSLIEESKDSFTLNTKKLFEIFLTDTSNLFKYIINHDNTRKYMIKSLITINIPLAYKGEVLYIMILNFEYRINNFIKKEFFKYIEKEELSLDELNYLIFLIKALGEMGLQDGYNAFKKACNNKNWTIKAIAAKYLYKFDKEDSYMYLEKFLHDSVWWVRNNAALSLDKMGTKGIKILLETLESEDKFAREISSYILTSGSYYSLLKEELSVEAPNLKNFYKLIKSPSGLVIIDRIIIDKSINVEVKIDIMKNINDKNHKIYLLNLAKRNSVDVEIRKYIKTILELQWGDVYERTN